ncbi:hypothetical protein SprV_1002828900 [Sparganum proliferum]
MPPTQLLSPLTRTAAWRTVWDTIQSKALAVVCRAPRHLQPALREGLPAKSLHRPPLRRRQQSSILPLPPPCATASARDAERTDGPQAYGDPRERGPQRMEELLLRHQSHLLSARQRRRRKNPAHREDTNAVAIGRTIKRCPEMPIHHLRHRHRPPAPWKTNTNLDLPLSLHETIRTVQQLSSGIASAPDAAPAKVYKHGGPQFMEHLTALFQAMWRQGEVPQDFKDTTIIHLSNGWETTSSAATTEASSCWALSVKYSLTFSSTACTIT